MRARRSSTAVRFRKRCERTLAPVRLSATMPTRWRGRPAVQVQDVANDPATARGRVKDARRSVGGHLRTSARRPHGITGRRSASARGRRWAHRADGVGGVRSTEAFCAAVREPGNATALSTSFLGTLMDIGGRRHFAEDEDDDKLARATLRFADVALRSFAVMAPASSRRQARAWTAPTRLVIDPRRQPHRMVCLPAETTMRRPSPASGDSGSGT